jgi:hypothetical protein
MGEEFEDRDLSDAVFWGVRLNGAMFRDVDFAGVRTHHVFLTDVEIDGFIDGLVVNGVDVTDYVHAHDPWQPLRGMLLPTTASEVAAAWEALSVAWAKTIEEATTLAPEALEESVNGEWSFFDTLRHLVFVSDKWILDPLSGAPWQAIGLPNTGSRNFPWPGINLTSQPSLDDVLTVRRSQGEAIDQLVQGLRDDDLDRSVTVVENGHATALDCWHTLLEEEFEHRRYALRDLAILRPDQISPTGAN